MKRLLGNIAATFLVLVLATGAATRAQAPTFTVLHSFSGADGANSHGDLIRDAAGNLYGTTAFGGTSSNCSGGCGTVFKLDTSGNETVLYSFKGGSDGQDPSGGLVMDAARNLYGTTVFGGAFLGGTVFKLDTLGSKTVLHNFPGSNLDGVEPNHGVIIDKAGNLYSTTYSGGVGTHGIVFKLDASGNETVLHSFAGAPDGALPASGVITDQAGNLYGTTQLGGTSGSCFLGLPGCGTVFKLDTSGNETVLHSFTSSDGADPLAGLVMDAAGNLYGTTDIGGASGDGTVFKLDTSGNETVLHSFTGADGARPDGGLIMDAAGNLYGTTAYGGAFNSGTVFKLDPAGNGTVLHSFTGGDGANPFAALIMDAAGNLYGTTSGGGSFGGGTVFRLTFQTAPTITSISPTSAIAGGPAFTLTVNGANFVSGATVKFNSNTLATTFASATQLTAAILASDIATAGSVNVTVTNPGGGTSNAVSFTVVTVQEATQAIINSVNVLFSNGVINSGQDNSLVGQLQHAIDLMNAGKSAGAIGNLDSFISEVNDLLSSGVLSPSQAASLISAAQSVIAAMP